MKLIYIKSEFELFNKPDWLDSYRAKYDEAQELHVSLKRQTFVEDDDIAKILEKTQKLAEQFDPFDIAFAGKHIDTSPRGTYVMIPALANKTLSDFMKEAFKTYAEFSHYVRPQYATYDQFQKPHVTLGRKLTGQKLLDAKKELPEKVELSARIDAITVYVFPHDVGDRYMDFVDQAEVTRFELGSKK